MRMIGAMMIIIHITKLINMIKLIKQAIGIYNYSNEQKEEFVPTFRTTHPQEPIAYSDWVLMYRVGIAYGKEIRHFG